MVLARTAKLSYNSLNIIDDFTDNEAKVAAFLTDTAKKNHYPENDLFIRPLAKFFDKEIEGIWLTTDGAISWHCCFDAYTEYDLEDFITNCIYKNMNIQVYTEFYDDSTLLIYFC